jgi:hypothetical protein
LRAAQPLAALQPVNSTAGLSERLVAPSFVSSSAAPFV